MSKTIVIPSAYNNLRVTSALETIVSNLDKFPVEELEAIVERNGLVNWEAKK